MALPPGRARLATKPLATGSATIAKTIGMMRVSCNRAADPQIATVHPAQFTQLIHKRCELRLGFRITHQHADPPHPLGLLRTRHDRPR
jgi:hypothetical protein